MLVLLAAAAAFAILLMPTAGVAASSSANFFQCQNGGVSPLQLEQCEGGGGSGFNSLLNGQVLKSGYSNWINGNSNGQKSHWQEGDFIPYRVIVTVPNGPHLLNFTYDTVSSGGHAEDYIGSYDKTESTDTSCVQPSVDHYASGCAPPAKLHANYNNPCADIVGNTFCPANGSAPTPIDTTPAPLENLGSTAGGEQGCGGSGGTFSGTQTPGTIDLFGPTGSKFQSAGATILTDNVPSGQNNCTTTVQLSFCVVTCTAAPGTSSTVVLTWGGHIASAANWGEGNSASSINGSPYHEAMNYLDGSIGSQDLQLATTAIFFPTTTATQLSPPGPVLVGAQVHDTATVSGASPTAGGTVNFTVYTNNTCTTQASASQISAQPGSSPVTNNAGTLTATSANVTFLQTGTYYWQASYSGDSSAPPTEASTSPCTSEPITVNSNTTSTSTTVFDAATNAAWSGTEKVGASAYDTASVTATGGPTATGTVTYTFFTNGTCNGTGASAGTVTLTGTGSVPNSNTETALAAGSYSFRAVYSGDSNYNGSTGPCEPFSVAKGTSNTATTVFDAATNAAWAGTEKVGASAYDTASVTPSAGITASGTVTYTYFTNGSCNGTGVSAGTVTLTASGGVPNSNTEGPLAAGSYSFQATYSGDSNYAGSTGTCEPFSVAKGTSQTATTVFDAATNTAWAGTEKVGASAYDTASVTPSAGITASGTVTYTYFTNGSCNGTGTGAGTVTLTASGGVPNSSTEGPLAAGSYSFQAVYSGDSNYAGSTGTCEPFSVAKGTSNTATTVFDAATNAAWSGSEAPGASAYDTASVTPSAGITASGTVTYTYFTNGSCNGTGTGAGTVTLTASGGVPNSNTEGPLASGSYSFQAVYSGDSNYAGSTGPCEPFSVGQGSSQTATTVFDATTNAAWSGTETTGASAYDTATVTRSPSSGPIASGTVTYTFFSNSTCSGTGAGAGTVTLTGTGSVPNSNTETALAAGSYSFQAVYSGDANYTGSTGPCEPFTVGQGSSNTSTTVFDAGTNAPWAGNEGPGSSAYDTASVSTSDGLTATGTVSYTFFMNGTCDGSGTSAGTVTLDASGNVPNSSSEGPLPTGHYSFQATYSGDSNYAGSTGKCEPFDVGQGSSQTATAVYDATTNAPWAGTETTGASAYDTATVTPSDGFVATGTVTYTFFTNGSCDGTGTGAGTVTLQADGSVPNSNTEAALAAGSYSFQAVYSGDANYAGSTGPCEPFTVGQGTSQTATVVYDAATNAPWAGTETTGASAYDTATVTSSDGITATGTVAYTFFTNGTCDGTGTGAGTVTLTASGNVPSSSTEGPLAAGSYSFQAVYSGDANYAGSTGSCEPFTVGQGSSETATTVFDAATNAAWSGTETTGASAYDTATVSPSDGFTATGTVSYTFFANGGCKGSGTGAGTVSLDAAGNVPNSSTEGPLAAGSYSFQATYSGDSNYAGSTGPCEPFAVAQGTSQTSTTVYDAGTNAPWAGNELPGSSAFDTATVSTSDGFTATGTVSYTFFTNGTCDGSGTSAGTVTLDAAGNVPNSATEGPLPTGSYSFQATYSGDANYAGSTGTCEPFSVGLGSSKTATVVYDANTNAPWAGTETTGASAYDTATVTPSDGFVATGTVAYTFFTNGTCDGTGTSAGTVTLDAAGNVPNSNTESGLAAGSYSFQATYSGDTNYAGSTGKCEPFTVNPGTSNTATVVFDAKTNAPWAGTETTGASAYDTATVTSSDGITATGTVTYTFFSNGTCNGTGVPQLPVSLDAAGDVPNSNTVGPLAAGSYSFQATYSGDANYGGSTGTCEPFAVKSGTSNTATVVFDATTNAAWDGTESVGSSAYDTATVTTSDGFTATGTVSYTFFGNGTCNGTGTPAGTVTLDAAGNVPNSTTEGPLSAGSYSFQATYSGDSNYGGSTGTCEPFTVGNGTSNTSTTVYDAKTNAPWTGNESTGSSAYDTATVTTSDGVTATGTVTYTFFANGTCNGTGASAGTVTLKADGSVPNSNTESALAAGSYSFQASYSGDANYAGSTGKCEPFTVGGGTSNTSTTVFDAKTNAAWAGTELPGASAYDTATVTTSDGITATGTVSYTFFTNGTCNGSGTGAGTVTLTAAGAVPNSNTETALAAGSYSFQATYSGDANYSGSTGSCEPFTVKQGTSTTATVVYDAATNAPWAGNELTPASAYDTATVTRSPSSGPVATGTVTYTFFTNGTCSGTGTAAGSPSLTATGAVPNSSTEGPLAAGSYSFQATYSGDTNYSGSTGSCEPFKVTQPIPSQITPTNTSCQQFAGGTAGTLNEVDYQTASKKGVVTISNAQPGVFFYYVKVTAPAASFTADVTFAPTAPTFGISGTFVYDAGCNTYKSVSATTTNPADVKFSFTKATPGATYIIAVKYTPKALVGQKAPVPDTTPLQYSFGLSLNGGSILGPSIQNLNLVKTSGP